MRKHPNWTKRMPALIAGAVIVGCAALGVGTLAKVISASYASTPSESADTGMGALPHVIVGQDEGKAPVSAATIAAANPRTSRAWCPECGIVESIVELEPYADIGEQRMVPVNADDDTRSAANDRARVAPARRFAMTVRFRDGTRTVFHEATARSWHPGVRVIVIAGGTAAMP